MSEPVAFDGWIFLSSRWTTSGRKWTVWRRAVYLALTSGNSSPLKSLSSEHFPEKNLAKHSTLSLLDVCFWPSSSLKTGNSWFRPQPPACFIVDHHWRLDKVPLFILRWMDRLCASSALWIVLVAPSVAVMYAPSKSAENGLWRWSRHASPFFLMAEEHSGDHQAGSVSFVLEVLFRMKRTMPDLIILVRAVQDWFISSRINNIGPVTLAKKMLWGATNQHADSATLVL